MRRQWHDWLKFEVMYCSLSLVINIFMHIVCFKQINSSVLFERHDYPPARRILTKQQSWKVSLLFAFFCDALLYIVVARKCSLSSDCVTVHTQHGQFIRLKNFRCTHLQSDYKRRSESMVFSISNGILWKKNRALFFSQTGGFSESKERNMVLETSCGKSLLLKINQGTEHVYFNRSRDGIGPKKFSDR